MPEYIEREAAITKLRLVEIRESIDDIPAAMLTELKAIPAADVVERPRWITMEERLPNPEVEVLVFTHDGIIGLDKFFGVVFGLPTFSKRGAKRVTHWMPLPQPPEEES